MCQDGTAERKRVRPCTVDCSSHASAHSRPTATTEERTTKAIWRGNTGQVTLEDPRGGVNEPGRRRRVASPPSRAVRGAGARGARPRPPAPWSARVGRAALLALLLAALPRPGAVSAERVFYRGETWLETSPPVQRLSLHGVLQGWSELAARAEREPPAARGTVFLRLHRCLSEAGYPTDALLEPITALARRAPERVYYSLSHFIAEALQPVCEARRAE